MSWINQRLDSGPTTAVKDRMLGLDVNNHNSWVSLLSDRKENHLLYRLFSGWKPAEIPVEIDLQNLSTAASLWTTDVRQLRSFPGLVLLAAGVPTVEPVTNK